MAMTALALARLPSAEQEEYLALRQAVFAGESLSAFIGRVFPHHPPPRHFKPIIRLIERAARGQRMRVCISMPPRHGKTELILYAIAWWLSRAPADTHAYFAYNEKQGQSKSRKARRYVRKAGIKVLGDSTAVSEWRLQAGGGLLAGGVGGGLTGQGVSGMMIVDDPFKDRKAADSEALREQVWEWFTEVAMTRLEGASVFVIHTRWHEDDLIGRLAKQGGWDVINIPALAEAANDNGQPDILGRAPGEALWPERFTAEDLAATRAIIGEFSFAALYQGAPRPRGAKVFGEPHYYDPARLDLTGCRLSLAADPAGSEKTSADYSAAAVLAVRGRGDSMVAYVLRVYREHVTIPQFVQDLVALQKQYGNTAINVESVGGFKAIPQMLRALNKNLRVNEIIPVGDKFTRAQPAAAAWNGARLLVPSNAPPWLADFLAELKEFTGVKDAYDDQVDALAHAWNHVTAVSTLEVPASAWAALASKMRG